jgi:inward rectifier potassium channel
MAKLHGRPDGRFPGPADVMRGRTGRVSAIIKGKDKGRWTDFYHGVLTANWFEFFLGLGLVFCAVNLLFALLYMADPHGIANARPGSLADAFFFSVQTFGSIGYGAMTPHSTYANILVTAESFFSIVNIAVATGLVFARISRPFARVLFSNVAVVAMFDGVPTLMFRAANQRGNQILNAAISVSFARQSVSKEGIAMRRFDELKLVRAQSPLFALSWTVMHRIDESSPLYGQTPESLLETQAELIALLSGTDDTFAETIYARQAYRPHQIRWSHRFADVLSVDARGRRVVNLHRFHDTEAETAISAP